MVVSAGDGAEGGGADRSAVTGGRRLDEAALPFGAEPVAVAADRQHVAVVQELVEDGSGDHGIAEHGRVPLFLTGSCLMSRLPTRIIFCLDSGLPS